MSDTYGRMLPPPETPADPGQVTGYLSRIPRWFLPNLISLARGEAPPPLQNLPAEPGKVPGTGDPRVPAALAEGANVAANLAPLAIPAGAAGVAVRGVESLAPRLGAVARDIASYRPPAAALPGLASTLASNEAEAAPRLTRQQQRELELQRQQQEMAAEAERRRAETATAAERQRALDAAEVERQRGESAARIEIERQRAADAAARENEAALANRPFRERFPALSNAMSNAGLALSALLPYGTRAWQAGRQTGFNKAWEATVTKAEDALNRGDMAGARLLVNQLDSFRKQAMVLDKSKGASNMGLYAASAALPIETSMLPEAIDLASGSPEAKARAVSTMMDPVRIPSGLAQGATMAAIAAKAPLLGTNRLAPVAQSAGAVKTYREMLRQQAAQKAASTRRRAAAAAVSPASEAPSTVVPFSIAPPGE